MLTDTQIKNRRDGILDQMRAIRRLKRGQLSTQTLRRTAPDGSFTERGPYHLFQRWENGKNLSQRIPASQLHDLQQAVAGYHQFKALAEEFATLTETLTERSGPLLPAKKNSRPQPGKQRSPKRKPSSKSPAGG